MMTDLNKMCAYERGEYDCLHGHPVSDNESPEYYSGYGDQYEQEQIATHISEQHLIKMEKSYERI